MKKRLLLAICCVLAFAPVTGSAIVFTYSSDIVSTTSAASSAWREFCPAFSFGVQNVAGSIAMDQLPTVDLRPDDASVGLYRVENATMSIAGVNSITGAIIEEFFTGALEISIFCDVFGPPSSRAGRFVMHMVGFALVEADGPSFFGPQFLSDSIENLFLPGIAANATLFRYGEDGLWAYGDRGGRVRLDTTSVPDEASSAALLGAALLALGLLARRMRGSVA